MSEIFFANSAVKGLMILASDHFAAVVRDALVAAQRLFAIMHKARCQAPLRLSGQAVGTIAMTLPSGEDYVSRFARETEFAVRVKPQDAAVSLVREGDQR
jgi:hypothetical protein